MKIGTTSFGFRYLLMDRETAPSLESLFERCAQLGLQALQICENARPLELSAAEWESVVATALSLGVEPYIGCKTLELPTLEAYAERAAVTPSRMLRIVLEREGGPAPRGPEITNLLNGIAPTLEKLDLCLAIENHFDVPSSVLREAARPFPESRVAFCVDTANSLRNFESPELVLELLCDRACCYHLKDFQVRGNLLGFIVEGAPLGQGRLDVLGMLRTMHARFAEPLVFLENWVPQSGNRAQDIQEDEKWLRQSLGHLGGVLALNRGELLARLR